MMSEMSGGTSVERFTGWLRAAVADPQIKNILIDADSPGGTVPGVPELADEIYKAKESKPIIAVANAEAASAAYWIISQASEIVVSPSAEVGSIGVFAAHQDISKAAEMRGVHTSLISAGKFKTEANPFEPLTDEARASLQSKVNDYYGQFTKAVARGRNVGQQQVENGFGEGRMVSARQAVAQGMADRIATMDQTLTRLGVRGKKISLPPKAEVQPEESAQAPALPAAADNTALLHEMRRRELELYS
jgi:signal peptide peptidase SppA